MQKSEEPTATASLVTKKKTRKTEKAANDKSSDQNMVNEANAEYMDDKVEEEAGAGQKPKGHTRSTRSSSSANNKRKSEELITSSGGLVIKKKPRRINKSSDPNKVNAVNAEYVAKEVKEEADAGKKTKAYTRSTRSSNSANNKRKSEELSKSRTTSVTNKKTRKDKEIAKSSEQNKLYGFDKGLVAEKILGASTSNGLLEFLIQFRGVQQPEMIPASVVNLKIPQMVIKFYEQHIVLYSDNEPN
ncbi:heterochromatin protein 1-like [Teleopsis dalmanni]|uniref:heterochromatin protein 1-like n=1 Tax=Teleopsis dalmanni TaxID=139649 RepID=UPI0018CE0BFA|nr:heterochromatin protein 1-like [Teleopsis dalmanni]